MRQCDATTIASTYSDSHRCLKRHGLKKVGRRILCAHHYAAMSRKDDSAVRHWNT